MEDAKLIKDTRDKLGKTQAEMADYMGYSFRQVVSAIEQGKHNMAGPTKKLIHYIRKYDLNLNE